MTQEYEIVKLYVDRMVSSHHLDAAVVVDEIFTDEYNALDIRIIGNVEVTTDFYLKFKQEVKCEFNNIIDDFELISESAHSQTSIIVYLKPHWKFVPIKSIK